MASRPEPSRGLFDGRCHRYAVSVYYEDTDAGGVVYHANYLRWFERARSDILRLLEIDQRNALEEGLGAYVVSDMAIRFRSPARLGEDVQIESRCEAVKRASLVMEQRAMRGETRLCDAHIKIGFIGPDGRPRRQPDAWRNAFMSLIPETER